jgi:hypothetical protein
MFTFMLGAALLAVVNAIDWNRTNQRIRRAFQLADISIKEVCGYTGLDRAQLERELSGEGHLSMKRLSCLPATFHQWYALLLAKDYGMPCELQPARQLEQFAATQSAEGGN